MIDPLCKCGKEAKRIIHYLFRCNLDTFYRTELHNDMLLNHQRKIIQKKNF